MNDPVDAKLERLHDRVASLEGEVGKLIAIFDGHSQAIQSSMTAQTTALTKIADEHSRWLREHEAVLDGVEDKPGIRTRVALMEDFASRTKWVCGSLILATLALVARVVSMWLLS